MFQNHLQNVMGAYERLTLGLPCGPPVNTGRRQQREHEYFGERGEKRGPQREIYLDLQQSARPAPEPCTYLVA